MPRGVRPRFVFVLVGALALIGCNEHRERKRVSADDWRTATEEPAAPVASVSATQQTDGVAPIEPTPAPTATDSSAPSAEVPASEAVAVAEEGAKPELTEDLRLTSAGAEPRELLRLRPPAGSKTQVAITNLPKVKLSLAGQVVPQQSAPGSEMIMNIEVSEFTPGQLIHYRYEIVDTKVVGDGLNEQLRTMANKSYGLLKGLSGWAKLDTQGRQLDGGIDFPKGVPEQARALMQMMEESSRPMVPPLPTEAVGVGAKWEHSQTIKQGGAQMRQISGYELTSNTNGALVLDMTITQSASEQSLAGPGGAEVKMGAMKGTGTGRVQLSLDSVVPVSARLEVTTRGKMTSQGQTADIESSQLMTMKRVSGSPKPRTTTVVGAPAAGNPAK
jgi:hypothetical protein